jgi:hypothetical protein
MFSRITILAFWVQYQSKLITSEIIANLPSYYRVGNNQFDIFPANTLIQLDSFGSEA